MQTFACRRVLAALTISAFVASGLFAQTAKENAADAARLVKALDIHAGSTVGEIGAGGGELTIALAREVGDAGRIYSNDLNKKRLNEIGTAVEKADLQNVTLVEGRETETNLPAECCDAIFMRNVYHHFADPASMDASLFKSLKPGGRIAVIDFAPNGKESGDPKGRAEEAHHGVTAPTVERELKAAGFESVSSTPLERKLFMVVLRRPSSR